MSRYSKLTLLIAVVVLIYIFILSNIPSNELPGEDTEENQFKLQMMREKKFMADEKWKRTLESQHKTLQPTVEELYNINGSRSIICDPRTKTLVTLVTTLYDVPSRYQIHKNMLHNWASLGSGVRALVYLNTSQESSPLIGLARSLGWCVEAVPLYRSRLPVVRSMFMHVTSKYKSVFYGYVNSDILFDTTLVQTLSTLAKRTYLDIFDSKGVLIIGKRTNVDMQHIPNLPSLKNVTHVKKKGKTFLSVAQDYFITTAKGYPWQRIPDLVVGRPGYDNYLVIKAIDWHIAVLDATDTLNAIHQTGNDGNQASFHNNNKCLNKNLIYPFDYTRGSTLCAPYSLNLDIHEEIIIVKRAWVPDKCYPAKVPKVWECP